MISIKGRLEPRGERWVFVTTSFVPEFGPTLDVAFADDPSPNYVSIGIPELGLTVWL